MFHPAGLWVNLLEFVLRDRCNAAGLIEEDGTGASGSLIECEYIRHDARGLPWAQVKHVHPCACNRLHFVEIAVTRTLSDDIEIDVVRDGHACKGFEIHGCVDNSLLLFGSETAREVRLEFLDK